MLSIISLSLFGILNLFLGFLKSRLILLPATLVFLFVALALLTQEWNQQALYFSDMLRVNNLFVSFSVIVLLTTVLVVGISRNFGDDIEYTHPAEYYSIILFSVTGALMMIGFENLIMLFIGVEILSVAMYVLTGTDKRNLRSNEAALKYFLMGSFATGILLFGLAMIYGATGSFKLGAIATYVQTATQYRSVSPLLYIGLLLLFFGMLFKVSVAPFHFWTPDVYEGAPTIFTAYMSTVVKTAGFAALYKLASIAFASSYGFWAQTLAVLAVLTLLIGNITAAYQISFKRMMAYSSISHAGYLLLAVVAKVPSSQSAILFYSLAYSLATISAFGVLIAVSERKPYEGNPDERYDAFNGLAKTNPLLAFIMTVSMLSLAGIPLTAGFWGKFFIFSAAVQANLTALLVIAVLMSCVGIYYYFRVIIAMYLKPSDNEGVIVSSGFKLTLLFTTVLTLLFGLFPDLVNRFF
ncbi:NADH-quinone oxidoreductase subunit N [Siphonobacter sp. SORGH_AS_0500]|uniref:NADH-quinone oxidoreductase subunit N n=1 Tax=Siphonobacter sp. SORGH_AS_0500 TaxID=1864824 RepID=UPI000CC1F18D|nr:NADH-quinone oxidoreductase subunit N [Siphonobacter sp. SORGH_AS_0500]PKK38037.1 NADH-quinone oxidoreductase subunit N [Siphonobacter sp. SORGH_AS_0500]